MKGPGTNLDGMGSGVGVGTPLFHTVHLPAQVTDVSRDVVRAFSHNKRVGTYLLGRSLGEGSFAKVKEALHLPTGEKVAIKVIDKKRAKADPYVRKNLRREGRLLQQIRHQHVVQLMEVLETEHSYYLVTEYCAGGDLMDYIAKRKRLDEREVKRFIRQIVSAVDYLHRLGIIHRDLKIENLLLDQNRDIKLIDFGLSNTIKVSNAPEGTAHAQEYLVTQCGSPAYAAPELLNHRKYGLQVDVWSIGVNMYAMLTGSLPFTVDPFNIKTLYNKMMSGQMNPLPEGLSREGRDILRKFLTADPEKRITIAEALRHPWLSEGRNKSMERHPFPNKLKTGDLDIDILKHMTDNLGYRMSEVIRFVVGNVPSSACSTYHLYYRKLQRHRADQRSQGKAPADSKHVEPTRISLVLQDMTPRVTNPGAPTRALRTRGDSFEKEIVSSRETHAQNGHKKSVEKARTATTSPSTDKDSVLGKEKTFLSSMEHSLEDVHGGTDASKENRDRVANQSSSRPSPSPTPRLDATGHAVTRHPTPAAGKTSAKTTTTTTSHQAGPLHSKAATAAAADPGTARHWAKVMAANRAAATAPTTTTTTSGTTSTAAQAHTALADPPGGRKGGRVLVPLSRTFAPLRRGGVAGVRTGGGGGGGGGVVAVRVPPHHHHQQQHHQPQSAAGINTGHPDGKAAASPRVDGTRVLRATYPAVNGSSPAPTTPSPATHGHFTRQPVLVVAKRLPGNAAQWRSAAAAAQHAGNNNNNKALDGGATAPDHHSSNVVVARLAAPTPDGSSAKDAHSKRPVSPQALPLVRRRLAKRSRQDGLGQCLEAPVDEDMGQGQSTPEENVTVERLVTSPDHRGGGGGGGGGGARSPGVSQSGLSSSLARDLHMLPAISTVVTPRH